MKENTDLILAGLAVATAAISSYMIGRYSWQPDQGLPVVAAIEAKAAEDSAALAALQFGRGAWVGNWDTASRSMSVPVAGNLLPVIRPLEPHEVRVGSLAVFMTERGEYQLHQVVAVDANGFFTSGTANDRSDGWHPWHRYHGEVVQLHFHGGK